MVPCMVAETHRVGKDAAVGAALPVRYEASTVTPEGAAIAAELATEEVFTRLAVRAGLRRLGWRRIARCRPEDAEELTALVRAMVKQRRPKL